MKKGMREREREGGGGGGGGVGDVACGYSFCEPAC